MGFMQCTLLIVFGNLSVTIQDYSCFHAEADTVVFYALKQF